MEALASRRRLVSHLHKGYSYHWLLQSRSIGLLQTLQDSSTVDLQKPSLKVKGGKKWRRSHIYHLASCSTDDTSLLFFLRIP